MGRLVRRSPQKSTALQRRVPSVFQSRPFGCGGLENRFGPLGPTRVRIPPPPLNTAVRLPKAHRPSPTAVSVTAESSPPPSTSIHGHPLVGVSAGERLANGSASKSVETGTPRPGKPSARTAHTVLPSRHVKRDIAIPQRADRVFHPTSSAPTPARVGQELSPRHASAGHQTFVRVLAQIER